MEYIKLTQIAKFELHDDCSNCRTTFEKQHCENHLKELESLRTMIYEFLLETIRLENLEDQEKRIEIQGWFFKIGFIVRINKMMLHRASLYHSPCAGQDLECITNNFNYTCFILELFNERLKDLEKDIKYKWASDGLGVNPHKK